VFPPYAMAPTLTPLRYLLAFLFIAPVASRVQLWPLEKTSPAAYPAPALIVAAPAPVSAPVSAPAVAPDQERGALETSTASEPQPSAAQQLWEAVPGGAPPSPDGSAAFVTSYDKSMGNGGEPATLRSELSTMHLTLQSLAAYPNAVCNDGSPAGCECLACDFSLLLTRSPQTTLVRPRTEIGTISST